MCSNYEPVIESEHLLSFFGVSANADGLMGGLPKEAWPLGKAPFIRRSESGDGREVQAGQFGLLPFFAKEVSYGRKTYNARSETVAQLASFRDAWKHGQRCIVPAYSIFEPCWETGKAVRWCIQQPGRVPMGIAGIYRRWKGPDGQEMFTFAMLTVSGAGHPVFQRMHRPEDEKRMVLILDPAEYDRWLQCSVPEASTFFRQWAGLLDAFPAPLPPRRPAAKKTAPPPEQLF